MCLFFVFSWRNVRQIFGAPAYRWIRRSPPRNGCIAAAIHAAGRQPFTMNSLHEYPRYFLRQRAMLSGRPAAQRFFEFIRHVCADEHTFTVCHIPKIFSRVSCEQKRLQQRGRPVSRILCPQKADGNHSSRPFVAERLERPTRKLRFRRSETLSGQLKQLVSLFGLAPRGVYLAVPVTGHAGELLPHPFTHHLFRGWNPLCCTCRHTAFAACPDVIRLAALWCSDFPLTVSGKRLPNRPRCKA